MLSKFDQSLGHEKMQPAANISPNVASISSGAVIEDYNLPFRFRRTLLDQDEIDAVNVSVNALLFKQTRT